MLLAIVLMMIKEKEENKPWIFALSWENKNDKKLKVSRLLLMYKPKPWEYTLNIWITSKQQQQQQQQQQTIRKSVYFFGF